MSENIYQELDKIYEKLNQPKQIPKTCSNCKNFDHKSWQRYKQRYCKELGDDIKQDPASHTCESYAPITCVYECRFYCGESGKCLVDGMDVEVGDECRYEVADLVGR
jgi:hypothetical protein